MTEDERWLPFVIDEIPVWVRHREPANGGSASALLEPLVPGDVLRSVSRRDPIRQRADVWTSLNRIWASSSPPILEAICRAMAELTDPVEAVELELTRGLEHDEMENVRAAADQLQTVVRIEREEHGVEPTSCTT